MKKNGWKLVAKGTSTNGTVGALASSTFAPTNLTLTTYIYKNDHLLQLAAYADMKSYKCESSGLEGSYDVVGLDWSTSNTNYPLNLLSTSTSDSYFTWYRGEAPSRQFIAFNQKDCGSFNWNTMKYENAAWGVLAVPAGASGTRYNFNVKYDHTYLTTVSSSTWSAGLNFADGVSGVAGYSLQLTTQEQSWSKGAYTSYLWYS
jgi:hypothetical protein